MIAHKHEPNIETATADMSVGKYPEIEVYFACKVDGCDWYASNSWPVKMFADLLAQDLDQSWWEL